LSDLQETELIRYSRQIILPEVGIEGQKRLKAARVLVVGAGGLGSPCLLYLAAAGVGRIGLVDIDPIDLTNLQRQILYSTEAVGRSKVQSAAMRLQALNNEIEIQVHEKQLVAANAAEIIGSYNIVIDGTDNFSTRYLVNDACVLLHKPNVYGGIYRFEGQVSLFHPPAGPCYRCLFPTPPEAALNCAEAGVLGVVAGVIGTLQATEAVKWILNLGSSLAGCLLLYDALEMRFIRLNVTRDPNCPVCSDKATIKQLSDELVTCSNEQKTAIGTDELTAVELHKRLKRKDRIVLLDVRSPDEFAIDRLPAAILIPLNELKARLSELDAKDQIVAYCSSGFRSRQAVNLLHSQGFHNVRNLTGGIVAWRALPADK
jgi:molybdopterin/thiamine biosynthesis adenylyltransferase/rhodanese-related sulfurtransferase